LQSVLTNVKTIEEVDVRRPDQDEEELRDKMIVEQAIDCNRSSFVRFAAQSLI